LSISGGTDGTVALSKAHGVLSQTARQCWHRYRLARCGGKKQREKARFYLLFIIIYRQDELPKCLKVYIQKYSFTDKIID